MIDLTNNNNKISETINKLTLDNFTGLFSLLILGIVDSYFLSFYSSKDLAAATYANPFVFIILALFFGAGSAKTVFLSKKYKTNKNDLIGYSNYIDKYMYIISIITVFILWFSIEYILQATNINKDILVLSTDYAKYHFIGFSFCLVNICLGAFLRSKGNTKIIKKTFLLISFFNILFDPIFIFYFDLGSKGAAIATSLSWLLASIYIYYSVFFKLNYSFKIVKVSLNNFLKLLPSSIINQILTPITIMITVVFINIYGTDILSAFGVGFRIEKILVTLSLAIGSSILIFAGQNTGNIERQKAGLTYSFKLNFYLIGLLSLLFFFFSKNIVDLFNLKEEVKIIAISYLKVMSFIFIFQGTQLIYSFYLNVIEKHNFILFINILKTFIILPLFLYVFGEIYGINGLFYGLAFHHLFTLIITLLLSHKEIRFLIMKKTFI